MNFPPSPAASGGHPVTVVYDGDLAFNDATTPFHWIRPPGHTMCSIEVTDSGGGGGCGRNAVPGTACGGGGGGGAGQTNRYNGPAPPELFFVVPRGGFGEVPGGAPAETGERCYCTTVSGSVSLYDLFLGADPVATNGGGAGGTGGAAGGVGGAAALPATLALIGGTSGRWSLHGTPVACGGQIGAAGGAGATPTAGLSTTPQTGSLCTGGGGGGACSVAGVDTAGGAILAGGAVPGVAGGLANGGDGNPGFVVTHGDSTHWVSVGGSGGGSNVDGTSGRGGDGKRGSGGGGAGGGTATGRGGHGGGAYARITSW